MPEISQFRKRVSRLKVFQDIWCSNKETPGASWSRYPVLSLAWPQIAMQNSCLVLDLVLRSRSSDC